MRVRAVLVAAAALFIAGFGVTPTAVAAPAGLCINGYCL